MKYSSRGKITHQLTLTGREILDLIVNDGFEIPTPMPEASMMEICFKVPGGGDYSNTSVDFKDEDRVVVTWTTQEEQ